MWLRDERGWRREWLVGRLAALTNYTVYAIQDGTRLSGPIFFTTKSGSSRLFPCPIWTRFTDTSQSLQHRSHASSCMGCRIVRVRRTRCPSRNHLIARLHTMRQIYQTHSPRPSSPTSPILPQVCSPPPAVATATRPCKRVQIANRLIVAGSVPSRYPVAASFHKINSSSNSSNNKCLNLHSHHNHRALRRGTPHWAIRRDILLSYRA